MQYRNVFFLVAISLTASGTVVIGNATSVATTDAMVIAAAASPPRIEFAGLIHFCEDGDADTIIVTPGGNTVHLRGGLNVNQWVANEPLIDGMESNSFNVNLNPVGGAVHLDVTLRPDAVDGTWEISQTLHFKRDGSVLGHGVGHGTGGLHGMTIRFDTEPAFDSGDNPCSDLNSAPFSGVIQAPRHNG